MFLIKILDCYTKVKVYNIKNDNYKLLFIVHL
ncbi:hypothetical protein phytr_9070 [Candidatus Phycorickettsia trachydisci]|uniref:Uncharacterized protein n=1 Tax=Candidatus Phycorickettsia trachydisci TaxID=2115978 RepID=A0A2P1P996_9RICK|nr:hypothetical protein phytr_9070 [Candidatus Phycorickettsia trachydisci]